LSFLLIIYVSPDYPQGELKGKLGSVTYFISTRHWIIKILTRQESLIRLRLCPQRRVAGPTTALILNRKSKMSSLSIEKFTLLKRDFQEKNDGFCIVPSVF